MAKTGRLSSMPLADQLSAMLAVKGTLTITQAMVFTGVTAPAKPPACSHPADTPKTKDGRCVLCKREADQRHYRRKQYDAALGELVARGIAVAGGKNSAGETVWSYTGPSHAYVPPRQPVLPLDLSAAALDHWRAATGREPTRADGTSADIERAIGDAEQIARLGMMLLHHNCAACTRILAESSAAHSGGSLFRETAERGARQPGHEACMFCNRIDEDASEERARSRRAEERARQEEEARDRRREERAARLRRYEEGRAAGRSNIYDTDGRRIQRDGSLCQCERCDNRVIEWASRAQREHSEAEERLRGLLSDLSDRLPRWSNPAGNTAAGPGWVFTGTETTGGNQ